MKKSLSIILALAMLFGCFSMSSSVMAQSVPELTLENKVTITAPKNGVADKEKKVASFTPASTGCYVFECLTPYTNNAAVKGEIAGGAIGINESSDKGEATQGFMFFVVRGLSAVWGLVFTFIYGENGEGFTLAAYCMVALLLTALIVGLIGMPNTRGKSLDQITKERYGENY
jgi:hypothetical protein